MNPIPLLAETPWYAPLLFAFGCALLAMILLRRSFRNFGKLTRGGSGPALLKQHRPTSQWDGAREDATARFNRQQVEMHELAREINGQIDSKLILLQELVAQSDRQIQRLEALLDEAKRSNK
ncbi:hypothetical protein Pla108_07780 [Botrimarina colliarenosi]|uniref:Uncharacterized protein n=1 Tax=Botrimarina colliarenosi TaxID=2528001 RepID=A0A5C6AKY5_9BACT|nr:hypothetical protein [Botrimarina colliarenosi]TWT99835.1 hypothetical protein Pla108_07780 [Botrimarina colliarenosi]